MRPVPTELLTGPFTRATALDVGVSAQMLRGSRFERIHQGVWRHRDSVLGFRELIQAAVLALPDDARITGLTRIQMLGLDFGPTAPLRFVVARDHHVDLEGVFLHRTVSMPPLDEIGVAPLAAYVAFCSRARVIDAIKVGDWLLYNGYLDWSDLHAFCVDQPWRAGAAEALWALGFLDGDSRSLPESDVRSLVVFAGLEAPQVNRGAGSEDDTKRLGDLVFRKWRVIVEYEGEHHQLDRAQYVKDIDRYASLRTDDVSYVQVTKEKLGRPRRLVLEVHAALVAQGYDGPAPEFGALWRMLFMRLSDVVGPRRRR